MRILFFCHYFPPEVNAPASRTHEHAKRWVRAGHHVTVVTCVPNCPDGVVFDGYRSHWRPRTEIIDGIEVVRVWSYVAANAGTLRRILNYVSFMVSAILVGWRLARPDVVVATSPQFFCGWAGSWVAWLRRLPFVLEVRDIWPESIEAVGAIRNRPLLGFLEWLERRLYRSARHIITVGAGYRDRIREKVASEKPIDVVTNGVDLEAFEPRERDPDLRREWGLDGAFVCAYVGTIGMAHGLEVVIGAAELLREQGRTDIRFLLVGDGARREALEAEAAKRGVPDLVVFAGRQPRSEVPRILASVDACLVHLRGCELFGSVIPSKIFETMAMRRPIVMGVRGEARDIVIEAGAGLDMEPDSAHSLVSCVERLADDPTLSNDLGRSAREVVTERFSRERTAAACLEVFEQVVGVRRNSSPEPAEAVTVP